MAKHPEMVRVAAVADLHFGRTGYGPPLRSVFDNLGERADVLALCGDLTDSGDPEEARGLARVHAGATLATVAVVGNHDSV
jgi:predicted MPP superfamily phosphohydrolase